MGSTNVFVYGTLLRGEPNHRLLHGAKFVREARIARCAMFSNGYFPIAADHPEAGPIEGEVYAVDEETLAHLDRLEGHPHHYQRTRVTTICGLSVEVYLQPYRNAEARGEPVPSGSWRKHNIEAAERRSLAEREEAAHAEIRAMREREAFFGQMVTGVETDGYRLVLTFSNNAKIEIEDDTVLAVRGADGGPLNDEEV